MHPFTAGLSGMGRSYLKGFQNFWLRFNNIVTREGRNNSNQTKHHPKSALENIQGVLLLPQANTIHFF